jgi:integrase
MWILLWRFAVSQKLAKTNEAEKVERRSVSRKIKSNQKTRQQLDIAGFSDIHGYAEPWLQLAMEASLLTLQARKEVCAFKHTDFRDDFLFVIRDKVAGDSHMAFIKIRLTPELESLRARAVKLDSIASPYLIHRRPDRMQRRWLEGKLHWTYVNERYLTRAFKAARDHVPRFKALPERERPTFHEIRGLGSRLHLERGMTKPAIQELMTHSSQRTTEIYLERGASALTDADFHTVAAPFMLRELLGAK